jgi:hypothetical protein
LVWEQHMGRTTLMSSPQSWRAECAKKKKKNSSKKADCYYWDLQRTTRSQFRFRNFEDGVAWMISPFGIELRSFQYQAPN